MFAPKALVTALLAAAIVGMVPGVGSTVPQVPPIAPVAPHCDGGEFRWTAVNGGINWTSRVITFTSSGTLHNCAGLPEGVVGGTFTGLHIAASDCMHPADGPLWITITWSNGLQTLVAGNWFVPMAQPTQGPLNITGGVGHGGRVEVVAAYDVMTPDTIMGCLCGGGVTTGTGHIMSATFF